MQPCPSFRQLPDARPWFSCLVPEDAVTHWSHLEPMGRLEPMEHFLCCSHTWEDTAHHWPPTVLELGVSCVLGPWPCAPSLECCWRRPPRRVPLSVVWPLSPAPLMRCCARSLMCRRARYLMCRCQSEIEVGLPQWSPRQLHRQQVVVVGDPRRRLSVPIRSVVAAVPVDPVSYGEASR